MKSLYLVLPVLIVATFINCQSGGNEKCKYGAPTAIFSQNLPTVVRHSFEAKGQEANEKVLFDNGISLEINQSGCNAVKQQFIFTLPTFPQGEPNWIFIGAGLLKKFGELGDNFMPFVLWGDAIEKKMNEMKIGEPTELESGHYVTINKTIFPEKSILEVELSEGKE